MTSYCPQTRYLGMGDDEWVGLATSFVSPRRRRLQPRWPIFKSSATDLIATRIVPSPKPWTMIWYFDKDTMGLPPLRTVGKTKRQRQRRDPH